MKKILIIEDDRFLGDVLVQKLTKEGFDISLARDGAEGFDLIKSFKPDLILLDIILPHLNGYEILERKFKDPSISEIPVIIISNSGQPVEINRALNLGVKDYLVKAQFDPEEVMVKVRTQIKKQEEKNNAAHPAIQKDAKPEIKLEGKKIMWIEDDKFLNEIISRKIATTKCIFLQATEGEEALKIIFDIIPDIILLDIVLPGMDGFEILRRIKSNQKTKDIPVIMLSNLNESSNAEKSKNLGADSFLVKATLTLDEIIDEIKKVIGKNLAK